MTTNKPIIRTITAFVNFQPSDFESTVTWGSLFTNDVTTKIANVTKLLQEVEYGLKEEGYTVQTMRIATNPFGQWLVNETEQIVTTKTTTSTSTTDENHSSSSPPKKKKQRTSSSSSSMTTTSKRKRTLERLTRLDNLLAQNKIEFCSVGPAMNCHEAEVCLDIVSQSHRFSCSVNVPPGDVEQANIAAETIVAIAKLGRNEENDSNSKNDDDKEKDKTQELSSSPATTATTNTTTNHNMNQNGNTTTNNNHNNRKSKSVPDHLKGGLGNFRFCAAASCRPFIPFFPAAKSDDDKLEDNPDLIRFAIGLENGPQAQELLKKCASIDKIGTQFKMDMAELLTPIQDLCERVAKENKATAYLGIDTSLNPSLDESGSVGSAIEMLKEVQQFGGPGTLGAAAEITKALQSLPGIKLTGYCGLMLPVCEDTRLAKLATAGGGDDGDDVSLRRELRITDLLSISSVCGVGIDTVPVPGDASKEELSSLILDVAGIAGRWDKSLSCRVFPVPGSKAGDKTTFDSPYMVNSTVFSLS